VSNLVAEARLAEALLCLLRSDIVHCLSAAHAFQHAKGLGCDGLVKKRLAETFGTDFLVHKILERCNAWVLTVSTSVMNGVFPLTCLEWNEISGLV